MSTATAPKLCVNCVHYRHEDTHYDRHRCTHPSHGVDLVTGAAITPKCEDQRRHESSRCGPAGYLFNRRDPIPSQPLQPGAVSLPVGGAGSGHTAIVVEEYFLGAGVALVGQSGDLGRSERAFELEAPGGRLVFDPDRAHLAEWLVPTVQGDVAPVGQALQAIDQEDGSEIRCGDAVDVHGELPPSLDVGTTAILSLPPGMGKSTIGYELARRIGCTSVVDEWPFRFDITPGALHLTNAVLKGGAA